VYIHTAVMSTSFYAQFSALKGKSKSNISIVVLRVKVHKQLVVVQELSYRKQIGRVSCINTNRSHNLATTGESRRYVIAFNLVPGGGIWLRQESLRHILASPGYAPGSIAVNVTWMERGFNACQTHRSMYHLPSTVSQ